MTIATQTAAPVRQANVKQVFDLAKFLRNGKTLEFIGEASTLGFTPEDAIVIKHGGSMKTFKMTNRTTDDSDIASWEYTCILSPVTIIIFND